MNIHHPKPPTKRLPAPHPIFSARAPVIGTMSAYWVPSATPTFEPSLKRCVVSISGNGVMPPSRRVVLIDDGGEGVGEHRALPLAQEDFIDAARGYPARAPESAPRPDFTDTENRVVNIHPTGISVTVHRAPVFPHHAGAWKSPF